MTDKATTTQTTPGLNKSEDKSKLSVPKGSLTKPNNIGHPRATQVDLEAVENGLYANVDAAVAARESSEPAKSPGGTKAADYETPEVVGPQASESNRPEIKAAIAERDRRLGIR